MRRMRRWAALLAALALLVGLAAAPVSAQTQAPTGPIDVDAAIAMLNRFGIVLGDAAGYRPFDSITRAEMVKILVAAAGRDAEAQILTGAQSFPDLGGHWASGYVAVAQRLGYAGGYPDGTFRPDANVTYAEAITFLARLTGLQPDPAGTWPDNYLTVAGGAGIIPGNLDINVIKDNPAVRGGVFVLAHNAFTLVQDDKGQNLYQRVFDSTPPELTLDAVPATTQESGVTISGRVEGAVSLTLDGEAVPMAADGRFSVSRDLEPGANAFALEAADDVGNVARRLVEVSRAAGSVAAIEAPESLSVQVGQSKQLDIVTKDANGIVVTDAGLSGEVTAGLGTFDAATGTFTAGESVGTGMLTLRAGNATKTIPITVVAGTAAKVQVTANKTVVGVGELVQVSAAVTDAAGNPVHEPDLRFTVSGADALIGPTTGQFIASRSGVYTVTAVSGELTGSVEIGVYGEVAGLQLSGPQTLVANNSSKAEFVVSAVDAHGNVVGNAENVVDLALSTGGATVLDADGNTITQVTLEGGRAKAYVRADTSLWGAVVTLTATDNADANRKATAQMEMLHQVATAVKAKSADAYLAANDDNGRATITYMMVDQAGAELLEGSYDIDWTLTGPAQEEGTGKTAGTLLYVGGSGGVDLVLRSIQGSTGAVRVTASVGGVGSDTTTVQAVVAGGAAKVLVTADRETQAVADNVNTAAIELTVTVTDSKGVPVRYTGDVYLDFSNGVTANSNGVLSDQDGDGTSDRVTLSFSSEQRQTLSVAHTKSGQNTITASGSTLSTGTTRLTWTPGTPTKVAFDRDVMQMLFGVENPQGTVALQLYDDWNNKATKSGVAIEVEGTLNGTKSDEVTIDGTKESKSIKTDENGRAVITVATRPYPGSNYAVRIGTTPNGINAVGGKSEITITVQATIPASVTVDLQNTSDQPLASAAAGTAVKVKVTLKDRYGQAITNLANYLHLVVADGVWSLNDDQTTDTGAAMKTGTDGTWQDHGDGTYSVTIYPGKTGSATVRARLDLNGSHIEGAKSINILAGADHHFEITQATRVGNTPQVTLKAGQVQGFTVSVVDAWGNLKTGTGNYTAVFAKGGTDVTVRQTASGSDVSNIPVKSATSVYLLVPSGGNGGVITISEDHGSLSVWDFEVVLAD